MRDETRADVLFSALAGERRLLDDQEDGELRALADLGAHLEALGPAMAAMARAEDTFDPSFAAGLHRTLLAAHLATVQPEPARAESAARKAVRATRRISRRMITLVLLALALAAIVVITILHGGQQTAPVGTGVLSPTATNVVISARGFAAKAPSPKADGHGPAPKTPSVRGFSPMERVPSPRARTGSGAAATQTAVAPSTAGSAAGVADGAAPHETPTPGPAKAATAPGPSKPTVIPGPSHGSVRPMLGAAGIPSSAGGGVFRYQLPKRTPSLPSTVSIYRLRPAPISPTEIKAITATFSGLRPIPGTNGLDFAGSDEHLGITPTTGEVVYTRLTRAAGVGMPVPAPRTALAVAAARHWLHTHRLFPVYAGSLTTTVTTVGVWTTVRIVPALHPALLAEAQIPAITVVLDHQGVIMNARIRWATVEPAGTIALISPSAATQARTTAAASSARSSQSSTQASPLFIVTRVTLAYQPIADGKALALRPVYLFRGTLEGRPFRQTVAAVAR